MTLPTAQPSSASSVPPTSLGAVGATLADVEAALARCEAFPLDDWLRLAMHPALREGTIGTGWGPLHRAGPLPIVFAERLNAAEVAQALMDLAPDERASLLNGQSFTCPRFVGPMPALTIAVAANPQDRPEFMAPSLSWTSAQRAAQEVVVGLLLAAGARPTADAWRFAASLRHLNEAGDAADTNPRVMQRLLAVASPWEGPTPAESLLHTMSERRTPWPDDLLNDLLGRCPNVDAVNSDGASALNWAAGQDHPQVELLRALLAHGADPNQTARDGRQAIHRWAWADGAPEVLDLLLAHGATLDSVAFEQPPRVAHPMVVKQGDTPHPFAASTVPDGLMAIHIAAIGGCEQALDHLLARGGDPEVPDAVTGNTPLHWAVFVRRAAIVRRLLATGMNAHITNRQGLTPLQMLDLPYKNWTGQDSDAVVRTVLENRLLLETLQTLAEKATPRPPDDHPGHVRARL